MMESLKTLWKRVKPMIEKRLKQLPVVDGDGRFKGMISRATLLRAGFREPK